MSTGWPRAELQHRRQRVHAPDLQQAPMGRAGPCDVAHIYIHTYARIQLYTSLSFSLSLSLYICIYIYICVHISLYIYIYIYIYCVYIYIYCVHIYIYIYIDMHVQAADAYRVGVCADLRQTTLPSPPIRASRDGLLVH